MCVVENQQRKWWFGEDNIKIEFLDNKISNMDIKYICIAISLSNFAMKSMEISIVKSKKMCLHINI